jgi:anaerobic magnesium-protoporphyrin IX monomethyl ester cyclase
MEDVCLVYTNTNTQGRLGTHAFDLVLPPLGLAYLAAALEKANYTVKIVDAFADGLDFEETLAALENRYRIVGFYCHTQNVPAIIAMAERLKKAEHPPHVIVGGPHATAMPEECVSGNSVVDAAAFGEGELTIVELVDCLLHGKPLGAVKGIFYREDGQVKSTGPRPQIQNLDTLPMPAYHLLPMKKYRSFIEADGQSIVHIIGSRGCFNDCNYCHSTKMWGPTVRWHSPERVMEEIDHLEKTYDVKFFQFFDDIFTLDAKRVKVLMKEFRQRKLQKRWVCSTRIDLLTEEVVKDLSEGGVHHVAIGIETVNDRLLKVINKNVTKEQTLKTVALCNKYRVPVMGMFILGLPTETTAEAQETLDFAKATDFHIAIFSFLTVYPGTNFWHMLKSSPYLQKDFSKYNLSQNFTYVEPNRSQEELQWLMRRAYLNFYLRPRVMFGLAMLMLKNPAQLLEAARGFATVLVNLVFAVRYEPPSVTHT